MLGWLRPVSTRTLGVTSLIASPGSCALLTSASRLSRAPGLPSLPFPALPCRHRRVPFKDALAAAGTPHPGLAAGTLVNTAVFIAGIRVLLKGLTAEGVANAWLLGASVYSAFGPGTPSSSFLEAAVSVQQCPAVHSSRLYAHAPRIPMSWEPCGRPSAAVCAAGQAQPFAQNIPAVLFLSPARPSLHPFTLLLPLPPFHTLLSATASRLQEATSSSASTSSSVLW